MRGVVNLLFVIVFSNCSTERAYNISDNDNYSQNEIYSDFEVVIKPYLLRKDFNNNKYLYNTSDILLIPQEYASIWKDEIILDELFQYWSSIIPYTSIIKNMDPESSGLARLSVIKTLSNFLRNITENKLDEYTNDENFGNLVRFVKDEIIYFSEIDNPGWPPSINGNTRDRILFAIDNWKRDLSGDRYNYEYSINDDLWRLVEAAANMYVVESLLSKSPSNEIKEIIDLGYRFINELGEYNESGWYFQLGSINDHPDNIYSGYSEIKEIQGPRTVQNLGWDTSHFSMFPSMLNALIIALKEDPTAFQSLSNIRNELNKSFFSKIIYWKDGNPFTVNYMDGTNGLYRYNSSTKDAYLPFETSGTVLFGHWAYLKSNDTSQFYKKLFECFPLNRTSVKTYQSVFFRENRLNIDQVETLYEEKEIRIFSFMASKINN